MTYAPIVTAYDTYTAQALAHEAQFAAADKAEWAAREACREAEYQANLSAWKASNPMPTDPTAMNGSRMGLMEWITERGD